MSRDENLVDLETDKVVLEVPAPASGTISKIVVEDGATVTAGDVLAILEEGEVAAEAAPAALAAAEPEPQEAAEAPAPKGAPKTSPAVRRLLDEHDLDATMVTGTGKDGRVTKADVMNFLKHDDSSNVAPGDPTPQVVEDVEIGFERTEQRVPMTRLRARIAERLVEAQQTAAMLTTFNEVDMTSVMAVRSQFKDLFEKKHGVKLGFMSFFAKACIQALKDIPAVNAEIDGDDLVYKNYYHIGVAVGTDKGLVVPVVRDADQLSLAGIELAIANMGKKARDGDLSIADMQGGTFTISNGGVYGSLMSTPILNAPQSGILGMHKIQQRPMVVDGEIKVRPMMYLALSYDHRIVDGKEAVTFLVRVKECLEDPQRMILDL